MHKAWIKHGVAISQWKSFTFRVPCGANDTFVRTVVGTSYVVLIWYWLLFAWFCSPIKQESIKLHGIVMKFTTTRYYFIIQRVLYSKKKFQPFGNLFHPTAGNSWEMFEHCLRHFCNMMHLSTNDGGVKISSTVASPHWFILNFTNFWSHQGYMCSHCILVASCTSSANIDMYSIFTSIWNRILTSSLIQCNF